MSNENPRITALLTLLQDDNQAVASLAMEQLLKMGPAAEETIAEYQEDQDPRLRHRMHQLSGILARRREHRDFIESVTQEKMSLWEGVKRINSLYNHRCDRQEIDRGVAELAAELAGQPVTTPAVAAFMREQNFTVPEEDTLDVDLYLVDAVLDNRYGSAVVLAALTQQLAGMSGWDFTPVLQSGRFCLIDRNNMILDIAGGWQISPLEEVDKIHPCARKDVWLAILCQLFLVALVEGNLRDLYHFGTLLAGMNGTDIGILPYPLGRNPDRQA